ncbi:MAG: ParB/RepB/Spo0J family partition protein [Christensenella sp.]|nr:ParB/RepB/Spo0J family partition protein [Christensenella sp.]
MEEKDFIVFNVDNYRTYDEKGTLNKEVQELLLADIIPNPNQPRKNFNSESIKELSKSIKANGVIQPILVVKSNDKYVIVAGERRYRASKLVGLTRIPAIVKDLTKKQIDEIALIENIQREDLNPIEEAKAYKRLLDEYQITQDQLANRIGKSRPAITNSIRLLSLPIEVQDMLESNRISEGHARVLLSIPSKEYQITLARAACDKQMSVRTLETVVHNALNPNNKKQIKPVLPIEIKRLVNTMQKVFATNVKAIGNGQKGRITIDYYTPDDIDRIIELIDILRKHKKLD